MAGTTEPPDEMALCAHEGNIELVCVGERWAVLHTLTREMHELPIGDVGDPVLRWDLEFCEEGLGYCVAEKRSGAYVAEPIQDMLRMTVLVGEGNELWLQREGEPFMRLADFLHEFQYRQVRLWSVGAQLQEHVMQVASYTRPRACGSYLVWSLPSVYDALSLSERYGKRSHWLQKKSVAWDRLFNDVLDGCAVLVRALPRGGALLDQSRVLPWLAASSVGVLLLLLQLIAPARATGGLLDEACRQRAVIFFEHLVCLASESEWELEVLMDTNCKLRCWPLPPEGAGRACVRVLPGGYFEWPENAPSIGRFAWEVWGIAHGHSVAERLNIGTCLELWFNDKKCWSIAKQFIQGIGLRLDKLLFDCEADLTGAALEEVGSEGGRLQDFALELKLSRYMTNCRLAIPEKPLHLSFGCDKSRVGSLGIQNGAVVTPANICAFAPPVVRVSVLSSGAWFRRSTFFEPGAILGTSGELFFVASEVWHDFVGEDDVLEALGAPKEDIEKELKAKEARQQSYVKKRRSEDQGDWRPRKRHRKDAWMLLCYMEHQLQSIAGVSLEDYQVSRVKEEQPYWAKWPLLSLACDQGSPEEASKNFMQQKLALNVDDFPDPGHGIWNDCRLALRRADLWGHTCVMMIVWNVPHGPWAEDKRYRETLESQANFFKRTKSASESWLFQQLLPRMLFDADDGNMLTDPDAGDILFQRLKDDSPLARKGAKISMNRFMSAIKAGEDDQERWTMRYFSYLMAAIEQDYLHGKQFKTLLARGSATADRTTSSSKSTSAETALIRACQNQLAMATIVLGDRANQYRQRAINAMCHNHKVWFEAQAHKLRSVEDNFHWVESMLDGGFVQYLNSCLEPLTAEQSLRWVGFSLPVECGVASPDMWHEGQAGDEDQLASEMATLGFCLAGLRLQRNMHMLQGFSCRSIKWLSMDGAVRARGVKAFGSAYALFLEVETLASELTDFQPFSQRSQFRLQPVMQLVRACESVNWSTGLSEEIFSFLRHKHRRLISTQMVEDMFQRQKRQKQSHFTRRLRVGSSWEVVLDKRVDSQVHGYDRPEEKFGPSTVGSKSLPDGIYTPQLSKAPQCFRKITSYSSATSWYSPSAERHGVKFADIAAMSFCKQRNCMRKLPNLWLSFIFEAKHNLLLRSVAANGAKGPPVFAIHVIPGSVALGWPAKEERVPGTNTSCWTPSTTAEHIVYLTLVDFGQWEAIRFTWRSPLSQWLLFEGARKQWDSQHIRAFASEDSLAWAPLLTVCARSGFWAIGQENLVRLCKHLGIALEDGWGSFDIANKLVQSVLGCGDDEALECLRHRIRCMSIDNAGLLEALLVIDEESEVLSKEEKEGVAEVKKQETTKASAARDFAQRWSSRKRQVAEAKAAAGGRAKAKASTRRESKYPPMPPDLQEQREVRVFCPPGGHVWRGASNGSWQCHYPPWPRGHYSWDQWGAHGAAIEALRHLWRCHLLEKSLPESSCPIPGLFEPPAPGSAETGAASSSSAPAPKRQTGRRR